jgi:hypothetical protein
MKVLLALYITKFASTLIRFIWKPRGAAVNKLNDCLSQNDDKALEAGM